MHILEIGTYTGYSALSFAEGLKTGGKVITIDINEELEEMVNEFIDQSDYKDNIEMIVGDASNIIPTLDIEFDIVFIDADKQNYSKYYDIVFDKVRKGGYIIADNVLWSGKVVEDYETTDRDTQLLMNFNQKIHQDNRVQNVLFPIRDGLMIARKI